MPIPRNLQHIRSNIPSLRLKNLPNPRNRGCIRHLTRRRTIHTKTHPRRFSQELPSRKVFFSLLRIHGANLFGTNGNLFFRGCGGHDFHSDYISHWDGSVLRFGIHRSRGCDGPSLLLGVCHVKPQRRSEPLIGIVHITFLLIFIPYDLLFELFRRQPDPMRRSEDRTIAIGIVPQSPLHPRDAVHVARERQCHLADGPVDEARSSDRDSVGSEQRVELLCLAGGRSRAEE
mmetsp:Transcript_4375/g.7786  ORF Transcript_4375/g.7786 Transcript_4375/m.7786 type:complete len:231 (+) Transcript_4375:60-752(+)